jgi:SAM-dependent methyltransferase
MSHQDHLGDHGDGPDGQMPAPLIPNDDGRDENLGVSPEAILHFNQFPAEQFMPEYYLSDTNASSTFQQLGAAPLLSQPSGNSGDFDPTLGAQPLMSIAPRLPTQPSAAQWSADNLNPFVPNFSDAELVRIPSGTSVLEEGSILGESGRTYHSYKGDTSAYLLPNDAAEQDRLDLQHAMVTYCWDGRLVFAPLPRAPRLVLDVATGTGIWALEFARANPTSFVVGTDLSKIQPVPDVPNCLFEKMDCEDDWMWTYKYDFIHIRYIVSAIRDPQRLIRQSFEHLNQGGWLEMGDMDWDLLSEEGPRKDDRVATCYFKQWCDLCGTGAAANGVNVHKAQKYKRWMTEAGCKCLDFDCFHICVKIFHGNSDN